MKFVFALLILFFLTAFLYVTYVLIRRDRAAKNLIAKKNLELDKVKSELQQAQSSNIQFYGKISHEIRTPLNLILGMIDLCNEASADKTVKGYLKAMHKSGEHLLTILDDLIDRKDSVKLINAKHESLKVLPELVPIKEDISIIVADDDPGNIELYKAYFSKSPWNVRYNYDGLQAWQCFEKRLPDLLILDVRMPNMDGFELLHKIRSHERSFNIKHIPVILITADLLDYTAETAKTFAEVTLLAKPIKKKLLFDTIHNVAPKATVAIQKDRHS